MNAGSFAPALVLNADFRPLNYFPLSLWSWQDTIKAVCMDRVTIISEYDQKISSPSMEMSLPSVIALKEVFGVDWQQPDLKCFNWQAPLGKEKCCAP